MSYLDLFLLLLTLFVAISALLWWQLKPAKPQQSVAGPPLWVVNVEPDSSPVLPGLGLLADLAEPEIRAHFILAAQPTEVATVPAPAPLAPPTPARAVPQWLERLEQLSREHRIELRREADRIALEVGEAVLFDSASAELRPEGMSLLDALAPTLRELGAAIRVEGHTDDRPIRTARFPSNWELSSYRASRVARHLIDLGMPAERLRAVGLADTQPRQPNDTPEGRNANRRVTLVVETPSVATQAPAPQSSAPVAQPPQAPAPTQTSPTAKPARRILA